MHLPSQRLWKGQFCPLGVGENECVTLKRCKTTLGLVDEYGTMRKRGAGLNTPMRAFDTQELDKIDIQIREGGADVRLR